MKKTSIAILLFSMLIICSCTEGNSIQFKNYEKKVTTKINENGESPSCTILLSLDLIDNPNDTPEIDKINNDVTTFLFGEVVSITDVDKAIDTYIVGGTNEYINNIKPLYIDEIAAINDSKDMIIPSFMYELNNTTKATLNTKNTVSFINHDYAYTGGAHGMYTTTINNYDLSTGKRINLKDIFTANYEESLTNIIKEHLLKAYPSTDKQSSAEDNFFDLNDSLKPTENFELTKDGIRFVYPLYQLAPYSLGEPTVLVPYTELKQLLDSTSSIVKNI